MRRIVGILAAVLLSVTLLTASVAAECAWVLWAEGLMSGVTKSSWTVLDAVETREECDRKLRMRLAMQSGKSHIEILEDGFIDGLGSRSAIRVWFRCFPDTIDPCGPKR